MFVEVDLPKLMLDNDVDVQIAACRAAKNAKSPELREALLKVLGTAVDMRR